MDPRYLKLSKRVHLTIGVIETMLITRGYVIDGIDDSDDETGTRPHLIEMTLEELRSAYPTIEDMESIRLGATLIKKICVWKPDEGHDTPKAVWSQLRSVRPPKYPYGKISLLGHSKECPITDFGPAKLSFEDFASKYPTKAEWGSLSWDLFLTDSLQVWWRFSLAPMGCDVSRAVVTDILKQNETHVILVTETDFTKQGLVSFEDPAGDRVDDLYVERFILAHVAVDPMNHKLMPKYTQLQPYQAIGVCRDVHCALSDFPELKTGMFVQKYFAAVPGTMFQIEQASEVLTGESNIFHRVVTP